MVDASEGEDEQAAEEEEEEAEKAQEGEDEGEKEEEATEQNRRASGAAAEASGLQLEAHTTPHGGDAPALTRMTPAQFKAQFKVSVDVSLQIELRQGKMGAALKKRSGELFVAVFGGLGGTKRKLTKKDDLSLESLE